jgi:O-antigen/teichoic acid export membrane protein
VSFARHSLGSLLALGFGVVVSIVLPRVLGAQARGEYQLAVKLAGLVLAVAQWGIPEVLLQLLGERRASLGALIGTSLVLGTLGAAAVALMLGLAAPLFQDNLLRGVEPMLLAFTLGGSLASLLALLARRFIQLDGHVDLYNAMDVGRTLLFLVLVLLGGVLLPRQALGPTLAWLLGEVFLAAVAIALLWRMGPRASASIAGVAGGEADMHASAADQASGIGAAGAMSSTNAVAAGGGATAVSHASAVRPAGDRPNGVSSTSAVRAAGDGASAVGPARALGSTGALAAGEDATAVSHGSAVGAASPLGNASAVAAAGDGANAQSPARWRVDPTLMRELATAGAPIQLGLLGMFVGSEGGAFVLNASLDVASVGVYSVALSIARLVLQISIALRTALQPRLVGPERDSAAVTARVTRHGLLWMLLVAIGLAVGSPLVPVVFTREFAASAPALLLMLPGMVAYGVWQLLASHLLRIGRRGFLATVAWIFGLVSVGLQAVGAEAFGLLGAAAGLSVAYVVATTIVLVAFVHLSGRPARELVPVRGDLAFYVGLTRRVLATR